MADMTDREFVEWCRTNQTEMYLLEQQRLLSIARTSRDSRALSVEFICDIATLRLDLAEARAQVAALTAERGAAKAELAAAKLDTERLEQAIDPALKVASEILRRRVLGTGEDHHRWEIAFLRLQFLRLQAARAPEECPLRAPEGTEEREP